MKPITIKTISAASTALITAVPNYVPKYNPELSVYEDDIPKNFKELYPLGLRCCNGHNFLTRAKLNTHTNTLVHQRFLKNYKGTDVTSTVRSQQQIIQHYSDEIFRLKLQLSKPLETLYVIKERENVVLNEDIYKVGITSRSFKERFREYPPGSIPYFITKLHDSVYVENKVKELFNVHFELVRGSEYFRGNVHDMITMIIDVIE
jgi:hypothetical protein